MRHSGPSGYDHIADVGPSIYISEMPNEVIVALVAITVSALLGAMPSGKIRTLLITGVWLAPIWFYLWAMAFGAGRGRDEISDLDAFLLFSIILAPWAVLTLFPFKLTSRLLEIHRRY